MRTLLICTLVSCHMPMMCLEELRKAMHGAWRDGARHLHLHVRVTFFPAHRPLAGEPICCMCGLSLIIKLFDHNVCCRWSRVTAVEAMEVAKKLLSTDHEPMSFEALDMHQP